MKNFLLLFGPNLNRVEKRNPALYGTLSLAQIKDAVRESLADLSVELEMRQSNSEGTLIDTIQEFAEKVDGIVFNPGALAHYSYALRDAITDAACPVVEVHFSNIYARESFRHESVTAASCKGVISGLGWFGLALGIRSIVHGKKEQ
jgi:3-dehydroquinate dehydratase-2